MKRNIFSLYLIVYSISFVNGLNRTAVCIREELLDQNFTLINGVSVFKDFIHRSNAFVDKTLLIKELLEHKAKIILMTCPRKWGKTLNLDMFRNFIEIPADKYRPLENQTNYKLFKKGIMEMPDGQIHKFNKTFLIANEDRLFKKHYGQYPVLHVNLGIVTRASYTKMFNELIEEISEAFLRHNYIAKALEDTVNDENRTQGERKEAEINLHMFQMIVSKLSLSEEDIQKSLKFLCQMLYQYHGKRVFVLMNEYEYFLFAILNSYSLTVEHLTKAANFFAGLYDYTFLNNQYLEKAVIVGILCLHDEKIMGNLDDIAIYDTINNELSRFYGFSLQEVNTLFNQVNYSSYILSKARYWYHGYRMNKHENLTLYNPWSIADFLEYGEVENYWEMLDDPMFLTDILLDRRMREIIESLVHEKQVSIPFHRIRFSIAELIHLKNLFMQRDNLQQLEQKSIDLILCYLCATGYLTYDGTKRNTATGTSVTLLRLPNQEVADQWRKRLIWHYRFVEKIPDRPISALSKSLDDYISLSNQTTDLIQNSTGDLINSLPPFTISEANRTKTLRMVLHYISCEMRIKFQYHTILGNETDKPDIILLKKGRGVFLKMKFDTNDTASIIKDLRQYGEIFYTDRYFISVKFIGIAFTSLSARVKRTYVSAEVRVREYPNVTSTGTETYSYASILMEKNYTSTTGIIVTLY